MTLPLNGPLGFGDINNELDISIAEQLGLGEALARSLASTSSNPPASIDQDTIIGVGNFYGAAGGLIVGYLVVGGGGGGLNGGGGGGGVLSGLLVLEPGKSYPVIVGAGGPAGRNSGGRSIFNYNPIVQSFLTPGGGSFVVPQGATQIEIAVAGAGGGGGGNDTSAGAAGQSGSKISGTISVTPGDVITFSVGSGGNQGASNAGGAPGGSGGSSTLGYGGGNGSAAGPGGASGGGGGGGAATVVLKNGAVIAVAGGGGGGGGGGNTGNASGQGPLNQFMPAGTIRGGNGTPKGGDGGGAGGGGGGAIAGAGGGLQGGDQGGYSGTTGTNTIPTGFTVTPNGGGAGGGPTGGGSNGYVVITYVINAYIGLGGGAGGGGDATGPGVSGSSGGGGGAGSTSAPPSSSPGGLGTTGQGYAGGAGYYTGVPFAMGGGGGAGAAGQNGQTSDSNGGNGVESSITGTAVIYGSGGGGYRRGTFANLSKGLGGDGAGDGAAEDPVGNFLRAGTAGTDGLGGGGGGGNTKGGNGVVIVSYVAPIPQMTGGTITSYGISQTVQVHTFTGNGVLTYPVPSISWGVPAGSLGTVPQGASITTVSLDASSSFGNPVTYTLNGALPSGLSFDDSTGVISGTTDNNVTRKVWNFSVTATDSIRGQLTSTRNFSYTISNPVYTTDLITNAGYQGGCTSINNRLAELQSVCNGAFTCTFNPLSYGDPFVGTVKQFVVTMSCTNGTGVYSSTCLGGGSEAGYVNWTFSCTAL